MTTGCPHRSRQGFTFIEIAVVMSILAVVVAVSVMWFQRARANREVDEAVNTLTAALRLARQDAISYNGTTVTFVTTSSPPSWSITTNAGNLVQESNNQSMPLSVKLTVPSQLSPLTFNANGSASAGGAITVASKSTNRVGTITVVQATGTVSLSVSGN